ncbi:hypothetical protein BH11PSE7_BH11PSE7_01730 [soil metagenome]
MDEIAKNHHAAVAWATLMREIGVAMAQRGAHAARTVVLVPYAQLMPLAAVAWAASCTGSAFTPRFESTMNWGTSAGGFAPAPEDISFDAASDILAATAWLDSAGLSAWKDALAARLVEAAHDLAVMAAAVEPAHRLAWALRMRAALAELPDGSLDAPVLKFEAAVAHIALEWAAASAYATDVLFDAELDCLVVIEGFQSDALAVALTRHFGDKAVSLAYPASGESLLPDLHAAGNAEDEAARAAACVLAQLAAGRAPVALVAQDRSLTRRVRAMLAGRGVLIRDETGWKLSTTRAAAQLMGLLRSAAWDATADAVLDWLKNAPAFDAASVTAAETWLRRNGVRDWRGLPQTNPIAADVEALRTSLQSPRMLSAWLRTARAGLQHAGQWDALVLDAAGDAVLSALRLHDGMEMEFAHHSRRMDLPTFTSWVNAALEATNFKPIHPAQAQVVILPLSQLLGRPFEAVVMPGCDELRLPVSPEPSGPWTPGQREALGLPSREALTAAGRAAWRHALQAPHLDLLWRTSESGEHLLPSGFVQELQLDHAHALAPDPRVRLNVTAMPTPHPLPIGRDLPVTQLSASAYGDLRACPYRFFAMRQLRLQEAQELENEVDKRDFGNWLHKALRFFHDALKDAPLAAASDRLEMMTHAAHAATVEMGLSEGEFLPFSAAWPQVRNGYLHWLERHEASGAVFREAEAWREQELGSVKLVGQIDRIDAQGDGRAMVIDYKTESRTTTSARIKQPYEDTQLAFYAALLTDDTLEAAYVNVGERDGTRTYAQPEVVDVRDALVQGILHDMRRIGEGASLPALGEGMACEYCAARGLCRKDFWEQP